MAATAIASGGAGSLDRSFGDRGKVLTPFKHGHGHGDSNYGHPNFVPQAYDVLVDSRDRVVAVGTAAQKFALARYKPNGRLDRSFSKDGKVTNQLSVSRNHLSAAYAGAIDSRGRIVAAGFALAKLAQDRIALARYKPNGHLDRSFGDHGEVRTGTNVNAQAVAIDPEGRIVVAGDGPGDCFALARYRPSGKLDPSFGGDGTVTTTFSDYVDVATSMVIDSRGRIVAAGLTEPLSGPQDVALARYESDGTLDPSFGTGGKVVTDFAGQDEANSIAIDSRDRIVATVYSKLPRHFLGNFAVARYSEDGSLDGSFGIGGEVTTGFEDPSMARDVAIDAHGRILVAGRTARPSHGNASPGDRRFALARYLPDGELDPDFSHDGKVTTTFDSKRVQEANALAIDSRQRIIAAGHVGGQFALARYRGR